VPHIFLGPPQTLLPPSVFFNLRPPPLLPVAASSCRTSLLTSAPAPPSPAQPPAAATRGQRRKCHLALLYLPPLPVPHPLDDLPLTPPPSPETLPHTPGSPPPPPPTLRPLDPPPPPWPFVVSATSWRHNIAGSAPPRSSSCLSVTFLLFVVLNGLGPHPHRGVRRRVGTTLGVV
jgi:hypothetical protein